MIHKVRVDYRLKHAPGTLIAVCAPNGFMIYDREEQKRASAAREPRQRQNRNKKYNASIAQGEAKSNGTTRADAPEKDALAAGG